MRVLICDNDNTYASRCKAQIIDLAKKHNVDVKVDIVDSWEKLLFHYSDKYTTVDLIYIEYSRGVLNGPEVAQKLREYGFIGDIVFNTSDEGHILEGYNVKALNYLIKYKTNDKKFEEVFLEAVQNTRDREKNYLTFSYNKEEKSILIDHILYFEVQGHMVRVNYYKNNRFEKFEFYSTLQQLCELLESKGFVRIHKSYLVSIKHIFKRTSTEIEMANGEILPIGRAYKKNVVCAV